MAQRSNDNVLSIGRVGAPQPVRLTAGVPLPVLWCFKRDLGGLLRTIYRISKYPLRPGYGPH
jgi:hypothetical protein